MRHFTIASDDASVLIVASDPDLRLTLTIGCRAAGLYVRAVSRIAEVERWPIGQIVITDVAHLSPWWKMVDAREVFVVVRDADEAAAGLRNGATGYLDAPITASAVAERMVGLCESVA